MMFDCNSVINTLNNISNGLDDSTSEKRLNRSYQDMYYTSVITSSITNGAMLIPTATAAAYSLIQASLMLAGGKVVLVTGPHGSGKSSITKQLSQLAKTITTSKLSVATASRWLCHIRDCGPMELQDHIDKARQILLPKMLERKLFHNYGTIMIDDVNIGVVESSQSSCVELFRKFCETKMMYNVKKDFWSTLAYQNYFILMNSMSVYDESNNGRSSSSSSGSGSRNSSMRYNDRFIRHTNVLYCDMMELEHVFEKKLQKSCCDLKDDLAFDLSRITFQFATHLSEALHEIVGIANNGHHHHHDIPSLSSSSSSSSINNYNAMMLSNADRLFIKFHSKASVTSIVNKILRKVQLSLSTFTAYTSNDVIRVWDRMIAEVTLRHPILFEHSNNAHEIANSNYNYSFPSFTNFVDREKLLRIQAVENAISILPPNTTTNTTALPLPLSYSKNTYGFFKTGVDVFPGL
jgi:energy-coupling factor transporter ATP-binding protein EcfA2